MADKDPMIERLREEIMDATSSEDLQLVQEKIAALKDLKDSE